MSALKRLISILSNYPNKSFDNIKLVGKALWAWVLAFTFFTSFEGSSYWFVYPNRGRIYLRGSSNGLKVRHVYSNYDVIHTSTMASIVCQMFGYPWLDLQIQSWGWVRLYWPDCNGTKQLQEYVIYDDVLFGKEDFEHLHFFHAAAAVLYHMVRSLCMGSLAAV